MFLQINYLIKKIKVDFVIFNNFGNYLVPSHGWIFLLFKTLPTWSLTRKYVTSELKIHVDCVGNCGQSGYNSACDGGTVYTLFPTSAWVTTALSLANGAARLQTIAVIITLNRPTRSIGIRRLHRTSAHMLAAWGGCPLIRNNLTHRNVLAVSRFSEQKFSSGQYIAISVTLII